MNLEGMGSGVDIMNKVDQSLMMFLLVFATLEYVLDDTLLLWKLGLFNTVYTYLQYCWCLTKMRFLDKTDVNIILNCDQIIAHFIFNMIIA